jgi:hypothetical protein
MIHSKRKRAKNSAEEQTAREGQSIGVETEIYLRRIILVITYFLMAEITLASEW